jgi:hypothetical protein
MVGSDLRAGLENGRLGDAIPAVRPRQRLAPFFVTNLTSDPASTTKHKGNAASEAFAKKMERP